jgi:hypothetical protein
MSFPFVAIHGLAIFATRGGRLHSIRLYFGHPLFSCPEMAEAMTTRAMDLPLTINCWLDDISLSSVIPILQARPIRSLSLVGVARRLRVAYASLALDLTYLEDFSLEATPPQTREEIQDIEEEDW